MTLIFSFVCEYVKERWKALIKPRSQQSFNYTQFANYLAPFNFVKKNYNKEKKPASVSDPSLVGHSHPLFSMKSKKICFFIFQTRWITHVIMIITYAEIYLTNIESLLQKQNPGKKKSI